MTRQHSKPFPWFLWHRRIGLTALLLLIILALTGIALNHTESLELDRKTLSNNWLLDWYGLNPEGDAISFVVDDVRITQWGGKLFFNEQPLTDSQDDLIGAARANANMLVVAQTNSLLLLDTSGQLIEQSSPPFMPVKRLGSSHNRIVAETADGTLYAADPDVVTWQPITATEPQWSQPGELTPEWEQKILHVWRGNGLTAERVILDLHSGRLFNARWGVYIMDAAALFMMLLGISGGWIWWSRRQKISSKKHFQKHHR